MSSRLDFALILAGASLVTSPAKSQDRVSADDLIASQRADLATATRPPSDDCPQDALMQDVIVVCAEGEADATERVMSPLPRPVASDRRVIREIETPPCWVERRSSVCIRGGYAPPPVVLIDLDAIPEALSDEDAAQVFAAGDRAGEAAAQAAAAQATPAH